MVRGLLVFVSFLVGFAGWKSSARALQSPERAQSVDAIVWVAPFEPRASARSWLPRAIESVRGEILELTTEGIRIEVPLQRTPAAFPATRIVWIEPQFAPGPAKDGVQAFHRGDYAEALRVLAPLVNEPQPLWQRQWLLGHLLLAAQQTGKFSAAMTLVEDFSRLQPPPFMLAFLPIQWTSRPQPATALAAAREKLSAEDPAIRLVAASWMLGSAADRSLAEGVLDALAKSRDQIELRSLAAAVRWRRTAVPEIPGLLDRWIAAVDQLPIPLQGGPLLLIADRAEACGESPRARELYLSVKLLAKVPHPLAEIAAAALEQRSP